MADEQKNENKDYTTFGEYIIPNTDNQWLKWGSVALQGLGKGAEGFAKGFGASQGLNVNGFKDFGEGVAEAYRKRRQEAEEAKKQEEAVAKQKREETTIKPIENDNQTAWVDYANKYWRMDNGSFQF